MNALDPRDMSRLCRTIFLSDIHLGTRGCQADKLLDFLERHEAETWYLVGDIVDGWRLRRGWHWPQEHNDVLHAILQKAHDGAEIIYVPGNHDEVARNYLGTHFGGIEVLEKADFLAADGRRFLVTHGDQFDAIVMNAKWLAHVGDRAYEFSLWLNRWVNKARRLYGGQYWSLSNWAKQQVKKAVNYISEYETVLADEARRGGYDGIVCGHIHSAAMRRVGEIDYINTGDWVESCTAVIETPEGQLKLIEWAQQDGTGQSFARRRRAVQRRKDRQRATNREKETTS